MNSISPFHATPDDLGDLDKKTAQGLQPLLDQLNVVMRQLGQAVNAVPDEAYVPVSIDVGTSVPDSFPITFKHGLSSTPRAVLLANVQPKDVNHSLLDPFVMQGWSLTDAGLVSVPWITNLSPLNGYTFTFWVR